MPSDPADDHRNTEFVARPDGASVAVHRLGHPVRGSAATLISHANGFHGRCYRAVAEALVDADPVAIDHRGHGLTPLGGPVDDVDWRRLGGDVLAVTTQCFADREVVGIGHSMGATALLLAARHEPRRFARLILFEPIVLPDAPADQPPDDPDDLPLVRAARNRRAEFASVEAAVANYASKPPLAVMRSDVLDDYVRFGTRPVDDGVRLRCEPEVEAAYFRTGGASGAGDVLSSIETPVLVVSGKVVPDEPAAWSERIAAQLPRGEYRCEADLTHFGPFSHPERFADIVNTWRPTPHAR